MVAIAKSRAVTDRPYRRNLVSRCRRRQGDALVAGLVRNVGDDELKHLIGDAHASVGADDFSWRRKRIVWITSRIIVDADYSDCGTLRNLDHLRERIEILPAEVPPRDLHQRNRLTFGRRCESLE